jgi:Cu(I)/Ag(I) efflux system membrane protein CusA/SilA
MRSRICRSTIPDLSDTQVIVYTEYPGQAPQTIEDQVTYPLTTAMLTVPRSKVVRGFSFFGVSFVYVIFEDGTDIYWARSRVLEFLNGAASRLPAGVTPTMGPDASGVGWVYQYAVISKELNLSDTRAIQDWNLKFALAKAEGVAEIASVGGFVRQYNVILDPQRMRDLGITMPKMRDAIRASNADVGGRTVELRSSSMSSAARVISRASRSRQHRAEDQQWHAGPAARHRPASNWVRMSGAALPN